MNAVANALIEHDAAPLPAAKSNTAVASSPMMDVVRQAIQSGQSIEVIREAIALTKELKQEQAREAFDQALSEAKSEIPVINKNRTVGFESKRGGANTSYRHEDLGEIARTVDPILARHGLSYRFRPQQDGNTVKVTCILSHHAGHSEESTLSAGNDTSGNKNSIQAVGSTLTYLQRYTLKMALGLAASADDDGKTSDAPTDGYTRISADQRNELQSLVEKLGWNVPDYCAWLGIEALTDLESQYFQREKQRLETKIRMKGAAQ